MLVAVLAWEIGTQRPGLGTSRTRSKGLSDETLGDLNWEIYGSRRFSEDCASAPRDCAHAKWKRGVLGITKSFRVSTLEGMSLVKLSISILRRRAREVEQMRCGERVLRPHGVEGVTTAFQREIRIRQVCGQDHAVQ
jgi:hypothetical protein